MCIGFGYVVMFLCSFLCICFCLIIRAHCNQIYIELGNNSIIQSSSTPIVLLQPLLSSFIVGCCNITDCAYHMFILYYQSILYPIYPYTAKPTKYVVQFIDIYLSRFVVCYLLFYTSVVPCRVVLLPPQFFEK